MAAKNQTPLLSIIVLTNPFRPVQLTLDCIRSISEQDYSKIELIVVDNNSSSKDLRKLDLHLENYQNRFTDILLFKNKKNYGYPKGNNIGIINSTGSIIAIMNNDIELEQDLIKKCVNLLTSRKDVGVVVPKIVYCSNPNIIWYAGGIIDPRYRLVCRHRGLMKRDTGQFDDISETDYANGSCFFIKREVFKKVGLFDPFYFLYYEEADLNYRIKLAGYKIIYIGNTKVFHKIKHTEISAFQLYLYIRNRFIFAIKNFKEIDLLVFLTTQFYATIIEFLNQFPNSMKIRLLFKGIIDGIVFGTRKRKNSRIVKLL